MDIEFSVNWPQVIRGFVEESLEEMGVSMPGNVVSYDRDSQTARVRPGLTRRLTSYLDEDLVYYEDLPDMFNVPVVWPGGSGTGSGTSFFHPGLDVGEGVLIICSDADFATWRRSGRRSNPTDGRSHHYAHSVCIPGLNPKGSPFPSSDVILAAGGATKSVAIANALDVLLDAFETALDAAAAGAATPSAAVTAVKTALAAARIAPGTNFFSTRIKEG